MITQLLYQLSQNVLTFVPDWIVQLLIYENAWSTIIEITTCFDMFLGTRPFKPDKGAFILPVPWQLSNWVRTQNGIKHRERCTTEIWWIYRTSISDRTCSTQVYGTITSQCSRVEWGKISTWVQDTAYTLNLKEKPAIDASFPTTDTEGQTTFMPQNNYFYQVQG